MSGGSGTSDSSRPRGPVHMRDGYGHSGSKVRAYCSCGYSTTPRASQERADAALAADHALDPPVCALCERDRGPATGPGGRWRDLEILTIPPLGQPSSVDLDQIDAGVEQVLVCRTDKTACSDLAKQRQLHLDRAAFEGFGLDYQPPTLRAVPDRRTTPHPSQHGKGQPT